MVRIFDLVSDWGISILAPPGYAKITSTPARSRASTKMSRPNRAGPTSARGLAAGLVFAFADAVVLLMVSIICGDAAKGNKKPTALSAVGFVKVLRSTSATSANGIAGYDDYQNDSLG